MPDLDPLRLRLLKLLQEREPPTDLKNASLAIGRNASYLAQFVTKGSPKKLPEEVRLALASYLGCDEVVLRQEGPADRRGRPPAAEAIFHAANVKRDSLVRVPEINARASAGPGAIIDGEAEQVGTWFFDDQMIRHELKASARDLRIIALEGDSMEPMLPSGCRIMLDTSRRIPTPPGIFVLWDGYGLVAKRVEHLPNSDPPRVLLKSVNPAYEAYERIADEVNIVGRVIWTAQRI